jgi:iron complex transport system permease protein
MRSLASAAAGPGRRFVLWATIGTVLSVFSVAAATTIGPAPLGLDEVFLSIAGHLGLPVESLPALRDSIVWDVRAPRVLLAAIVGAGLAVAGAVLQSATRNPLADPYLLGISSGASVGAVAVLVLGLGAGLGAAALTGGAFVAGMAAFLLVLALAGADLSSSARLVLAGVAVSQLFSSLTSLILMVGSDADKTRGVLFWLLGSLAGASWSSVVVCAAVVIAGTACCWGLASSLDALAFGTDTAASLGISVRRTQLAVFVVTALMTAALVAASGAIGFVGLLVPHAVRLLGFARHRHLIPLSALAGAVFLVWVEALARTAFAPQEVPVGVVTALIGVPVFAAILRSRRGARA